MEETDARDGKDGRNSKWQKEDGREQRGEGLEEVASAWAWGQCLGLSCIDVMIWTRESAGLELVGCAVFFFSAPCF